MKTINCPLEEQIRTRLDEEGNIIEYVVEPKHWDLSHYVDNGTKEGIKQRVHEEEMMIQGEVFNNFDYGINWQYFFNNIQDFKSANEQTKQNIQEEIKRQLQIAIQRIGNVVSIVGCSILETFGNQRSIKIAVSFIYQNEQNQVSTFTETMEL